MKREQGFTVVELLFVLLIVAGVGGWITNAVKLYGMGMDHLTGQLLFRVIGIFVPPLGAVMGFVPV